jgi:hypothetical protein
VCRRPEACQSRSGGAPGHAGARLDNPGPLRHIRRRCGAVAQLVERIVRNDKVRGSIPLCSTRSSPRCSEFFNWHAKMWHGRIRSAEGCSRIVSKCVNVCLARATWSLLRVAKFGGDAGAYSRSKSDEMSCETHAVPIVSKSSTTGGRVFLRNRNNLRLICDHTPIATCFGKRSKWRDRMRRSASTRSGTKTTACLFGQCPS